MPEQEAHAETEHTQPADTDPSPPEPPAPWLVWTGLLGIFTITLLAGIGRLLELADYPRGLAEAEMEHGILARQSGDFGLQWAIENAGPLAIPLVIVISWVGGITGYDIETPRIAAAVFGAGSVLMTGLWLFRAMGPIWGVAAAAVLAGSFWHILFSRMAIGQIAGAFALATVCWLLTEAATRRGAQAMPWYLLAGLAAGFGFLSTPSLRLLPLVVLGTLAISLYRLREEPENSEVRNWLVASAAAYLSISPYLISHRDQISLWTPWTSTPGLPGEDPATIPQLSTALIDTVMRLGLPGDPDPGLNLPADPWFSLLILPWAVIGLLGLVSASNRPDLRDRFQVGLGILVAVGIGISARDSGHPGQLIVISPALAALAVFGFRTVLRWSQVRVARYALASLIVLGVGGQAYIATEEYINWVSDPETSAAFNADVANALVAADTLDTDEPVFVSVDGHETALDYFQTTLRRHAFDGSHVLPFPADESGYLVTTGSPELDPLLVELLDRSGSATLSRERSGVARYRLDARIRDEMPFSVPTVAYPNGPVLHGSSDPSRIDDGRATFLVAWKSDAQSPGFLVEARLRPIDPGLEETSQSVALPANPLQSQLFQVLVVEIDIPDRDVPSDFEIRLRHEDGTIVPVAGMDQEGFLLLNRYDFAG